jgi:non-heme chloroperoxidase
LKKEIAMSYITTKDNTKLFYKDWGSGKPVIFLHGWPLSSDSWDDHAMAVADAGFRSISYDRRGFGRSTHPWNGYDYDTLADDLAAVIEQTGSTDATLVGFSMGGGEVARYMSRHAGKSVTKAVLVSSIVPYMLIAGDNLDGTEQSVFNEMAMHIREDRAAFFADFFKTFYGVSMLSHTISQEVLEWSRSVSMLANLKATLACVEAFSSTDFRPDLSAFKVPTLIVHGTEDKTVPIDAAGRAAAQGIKHAKLIEYLDAPHGLLVTEKQRFTRDLLAFLQNETCIN